MKKNNILTSIIAIFLISFVLISCGKSSSGGYTQPPVVPPVVPPVIPPTGTIDTVKMSGMVFIPSTLTVTKGTTVVWVNKDGYGHTVTSTDNTSFNSNNIAGGASFTYTANTVGTFNYQCNYHVSMGMTGTLTVTN